MQFSQNWNETWFIAQQRKTLEFAGKEASKFSNSCKWVWWTEGSAFAGSSSVLCAAAGHSVIRFSPETGSWHFNCWGAPTGDQLLGEQIGSSSSPSRFLEERLRRGEAVPWPRQRPTGPAFPKAPGDNALNWEANTQTSLEQEKGSRQDSQASF